MFCVQAVASWLLAGPVEIAGKKVRSIAKAYFDMAKAHHTGHRCNTNWPDIQTLICLPDLKLQGCLLTQAYALVCDILHYAVTDFIKVHFEAKTPAARAQALKERPTMQPFFPPGEFTDLITPAFITAVSAYYGETHFCVPHPDHPNDRKRRLHLPFFSLPCSKLEPGVVKLNYHGRTPPQGLESPVTLYKPKKAGKEDPPSDENAEPGLTVASDAEGDVDGSEAAAKTLQSSPAPKTHKISKEDRARAPSVMDRLRGASCRAVRDAHWVMGDPKVVHPGCPAWKRAKYFHFLDVIAKWELSCCKQWLGGNTYWLRTLTNKDGRCVPCA